MGALPLLARFARRVLSVKPIGADQGLTTATGIRAKSRSLRVTSVSRLTIAVAAIRASISGCGSGNMERGAALADRVIDVEDATAKLTPQQAVLPCAQHRSLLFVVVL